MNKMVRAWLIATIVALAACSTEQGGEARITGLANAQWGLGAGGPGVNPIGVAQKIIALVNGECQSPTTETQCSGASGCCPNALECCTGGPNDGMCAPDCTATYESNGCESGYALCGDECCAAGCDSSGASCADAVGGGGSGGGSGSCDGPGADCGNCCYGCDPNTNTCEDGSGSGSSSGDTSSSGSSSGDTSSSGSSSGDTSSSGSGGTPTCECSDCCSACTCDDCSCCDSTC